MAYDEILASRVRAVLAAHHPIAERRMFGGLCFLINGHMAAGVLGGDLILRVGPDAHAAALSRPHVRAFDFTGRPSRGTIFVEPPALRTERMLHAWLTPVAQRVAALPAKSPPAPARATRGRRNR